MQILNTKYISSTDADEILGIARYTKHDLGHVSKVAETATYILDALGYNGRNLELAKIIS